MRSKILDAIVRNQNKDLIPVVNTSMDIEVDWDASLKEDGGSMLLDIVINNVVVPIVGLHYKSSCLYKGENK